MLIHRFKRALGKSTGRQSLYDHTLSCADVALRVARLAGEEAGPRLDRLIFATFVHDVGKLDPNFQAMLEAAAGGQPLPGNRVKHEASTFDYGHPQLVEESKEAIQDELRGACGYLLDLRNIQGEAMEHIWAFAVTHHGLFYLSYERPHPPAYFDAKEDASAPRSSTQEPSSGEEVAGAPRLPTQASSGPFPYGGGVGGEVRPLIRRQWTSFYPREERRITLVDLLFEYHPLGGLVIMADLVASYCHEQEKDYQALFGQASSPGELFERLIERAEEIEGSLARYDPRDYALKETLTLLTGGIS